MQIKITLIHHATVGMLGLALVACDPYDDPAGDLETFGQETRRGDRADKHDRAKRVWKARLSGEEEVQTSPVVTKAFGSAVLVGLSDDRDLKDRRKCRDGRREHGRDRKDCDDIEKLAFRVEACGIETRIVGAHIHLAPRGENGPIVVDLLAISEPDDDGTMDAKREEPVCRTFRGIITKRDVQMIDFDRLIDEIKDRNTYVNVHSERFPAGEIRGQLEERKARKHDRDEKDEKDDKDRDEDRKRDGHDRKDD